MNPQNDVLKLALERRRTDDLLRIVQADDGEYQSEAVAIAAAELESRGVAPDEAPAPARPPGAPLRDRRTANRIIDMLSGLELSFVLIVFLVAALGLLFGLA